MINIINVSKGTYNGWTIVSNKSECAFILSRTEKLLCFPYKMTFTSHTECYYG